MPIDRNPNGSVEAPCWLVSAAALIGSLLAINIILYGGIGRDMLMPYAVQRLAFAVSCGSGLALFIWSGLYFSLLKTSSNRSRYLVLLFIATAGVLAVLWQQPHPTT